MLKDVTNQRNGVKYPRPCLMGDRPYSTWGVGYPETLTYIGKNIGPALPHSNRSKVNY